MSSDEETNIRDGLFMEAGKVAPIKCENAALESLGLSGPTIRALRRHNVQSLFELVKCREGDLRSLNGITSGSMEGLLKALEERGIELGKGSSILDIVRLRAICEELVSSRQLRDHGKLIGYEQTGVSRYDYVRSPKFYFQAFDTAVKFLEGVGIDNPESVLKGKGSPTF